MTDTGYKSGLAAALAATDTLDVHRHPDQADLFAEPASGASGSPPAEVAVGARGPGRPLGSRNKRTDELARFYTARLGGDPLYSALKVACIDITTKEGRDKLKEIGRDFAMKLDALPGLWLGSINSSIGYVHQRLATLTVKPAGSPEGEPIELSWNTYGDDEEVLELIIDEPREGAP